MTASAKLIKATGYISQIQTRRVLLPHSSSMIQMTEANIHIQLDSDTDATIHTLNLIIIPTIRTLKSKNAILCQVKSTLYSLKLLQQRNIDVIYF